MLSLWVFLWEPFDRKQDQLRKSHVHLEPARIEEELQQSEDGDVEVEVMAWVILGGV